MNTTEMLSMLELGIYKICRSLIYIVDMECSTYGQDESVKMAENYIKAYEEDHPELNEDNAILGQSFNPD